MELKIQMIYLLLCLVLGLSSIQSERTQYHLQGPAGYKFGFSTGDDKNPMERHEISRGKGHVKGRYSYLDPQGTLHVVHYEAHPKLGFRAHHHVPGGSAKARARA